MRRVAMRPAYQWTCDECGRDQYEPCVVADFDESDWLETAKRLGMADEWVDEVPESLQGEFVTYPGSVTCKHCNATFETEYMTEDGESAPD